MAYTVTNDNGTLHVRAIINTAEEKDELIARINQAFADRDNISEPTMKENAK